MDSGFRMDDDMWADRKFSVAAPEQLNTQRLRRSLEPVSHDEDLTRASATNNKRHPD